MMVERVTLDTMNCCMDPDSARDALGAPLASYLLTPEDREAADVAPPEVPDRRGCLVGLVVFERNWPAITRGAGIPLAWKKGRDDSRRLPTGLSEVAASVRKVTGYTGWGLDFSEEIEGYDLSALKFDVPSLWAPLAAGLELADLGGRPKPYVFATGRWENGGMASVGGIEIKMKVALDLARGKEPVMYVPFGNEDEVKKIGGRGVKFMFYKPAVQEWRKALSPYLAELELPPQRLPDNLKERITYANRPYIVQDRPKRQKYYLDCLVDDLAAGLAERSSGVLPKGGLDSLILCLSKNHEVCLLLLEALRPRRTLIIYTNETKKHRDKIEGAGGSDTKFHTYDKESETACLEKCSEWLRESSDPERCAVEVTGGTKPMTVLLVAAAQATGASILYLEHDYNGAPVFGTESIRALDWVPGFKGQKKQDQ